MANRPRYDNNRYNTDNRGYSANNRDGRGRPHSNHRDDRPDRNSDRPYHDQGGQGDIKSEALTPVKPAVKHIEEDYIPINSSSASDVEAGDMAAQNKNDYSAGRYSHQPTAVPKSYIASDGRKKFTGRCRLFFGNIPMNYTEAEFLGLLKPYGETDDVFLNPKKGFGFVKLETRAAAEACKNGLDGIELQGKRVRVRYATHSAALQVKNLTPHCTNELLTTAFETFGEVERAVVVVDDRGKSTGSGIVEFSRRSAYTKALESCTGGVFLISKSCRPLVVEPLDQKDEEDGLPDRFALKNADFNEENSLKPRLAEPGSFEYDVGMKWKDLDKMEAEKKQALEDEMSQKRLELEMDVDALMHEHKAKQLRQEMMKRQAELNALESQRRQREEQKQRELEMRRIQLQQQQKELQQQQQQRQQQQQMVNRNMGGNNNQMMGGANRIMGGANQMGGQQQPMGGPNNMMIGGRGGANGMIGGSRQGPNMMGGANQGMGDNNSLLGPNPGMMGNKGGNPTLEQQLLLQQQQALREMQMKQQAAAAGGGGPMGGNKPMAPPPHPPGFFDGRGGGGPQGMGGGNMNRGGMEHNMMMNQGGGGHPKQSRFDIPPNQMSANQQHVRQQVSGMVNMLQQQQQRQQQQRMFHQQQQQQQGGRGGPSDMKRPRRF